MVILECEYICSVLLKCKEFYKLKRKPKSVSAQSDFQLSV
jgi:hypothetical protein